MQDYYFGWYSDLNNDGVPETLRYSTATALPDLPDGPDGGRVLRVETEDLLSGDVLVLTQLRSGKYDHRQPGRFRLAWEAVPATLAGFARLCEEDWAKARVVSVRLDHRWRQLRVTSSGLADRTVTVAAGYLLGTDDTAWLAADATHVCGATHTYVYVTPASGLLTVASGTSVPGGSTQLAAITIAGDVVTVVTSPSGAANARKCRVLERPVRQGPVGLDGLELVLQEVR